MEARWTKQVGAKRFAELRALLLELNELDQARRRFRVPKRVLNSAVLRSAQRTDLISSEPRAAQTRRSDALQNRQARAAHGLEGSIPSPLRCCATTHGGRQCALPLSAA